jgi:hypothetical protein
MNESPQNPQSNIGAVSGSSSVKKFRRGKKFQQAYFDIGTTNDNIFDLIIEAETFERNGNFDEAKTRRDLAAKFKQELKDKYESDNFDLDYHLPKTSGLYVKQNMRDVL